MMIALVGNCHQQVKPLYLYWSSLLERNPVFTIAQQIRREHHGYY